MFESIKSFFNKIFIKNKLIPVTLEYVNTESSGTFFIYNIENQKKLNHFDDLEGDKMKSWIKANGFYIAKRIYTNI